MRRKSQILNIASLICLSAGLLGYVTGLFIEKNNSSVANVLFIGSNILETLALILLIVRAIFFGFAPIEEERIIVKEVKTVNVKPVTETAEEKLYKQYEDLYKQGLISEDDLKKKKEELLK